MNQLKKPQFSKVKQIDAGKHCYNVYGRILESKFSEKEAKNGPLKVVEGVIGDETGVANFKFIGENANIIQTGKVYAIRNGLSSVVNEHILLEVDRFGRVTEEKEVNIEKVEEANNISKTAYVKKNKQRPN